MIQNEMVWWENINIREAISKACQKGHIDVVNLLVDHILNSISTNLQGEKKKNKS